MSDWPPSSGPGGGAPPPSWGQGSGGPPGPPPGPPGGFGGPPQGGFGGPPPQGGFGGPPPQGGFGGPPPQGGFGGPPPGTGFGGPPPGPGFGGPPPGFGPPQGSNGMATGALVLGIIALVLTTILGWIPFVTGIIGAVLGVVALVLAIPARRRAAETGVGRGAATGGLVTGILAILFGVLGVLGWAFLFNAGGQVLEDLCRQGLGDPAGCAELGFPTSSTDRSSDGASSPSDVASATPTQSGFDDVFGSDPPPTDPDPTTTQPTTTGSDATSDPVAALDTSVFELEVGDCFDDTESTDQIQSVPVVPCDQPHDNEIIALVDHPGGAADPFPGVEAIETFGDEECQGEAFSSYVGVEYEFSRYFITTLTPTEGSWAQGDREILCIVNVPGEEIVGSVAGTAQ